MPEHAQIDRRIFRGELAHDKERGANCGGDSERGNQRRLKPIIALPLLPRSFENYRPP